MRASWVQDAWARRSFAAQEATTPPGPEPLEPAICFLSLDWLSQRCQASPSIAQTCLCMLRPPGPGPSQASGPKVDPRSPTFFLPWTGVRGTGPQCQGLRHIPSNKHYPAKRTPQFICKIRWNKMAWWALGLVAEMPTCPAAVSGFHTWALTPGSYQGRP